MSAKCGVKQVRRAMIGADAVAAFGIHKLMHRFAHSELAVGDLGPKHVELAQLLGCILNLAFELFERSQFSGVADLSTALAVEGRLVEQDLDRLADLGPFSANTVLDDRQHHALALVAR